MALFLIRLILFLERALSLLVIVYVVLTFIVPPWNTLRRTLAQIVEPMLAPLRRVIPPLGPFDITPIVLLFLLRLVAQVLIGLVNLIF